MIKISSTDFLKTRAIFRARTVDGMYLPVSDSSLRRWQWADRSSYSRHATGKSRPEPPWNSSTWARLRNVSTDTAVRDINDLLKKAVLKKERREAGVQIMC